MPSRVNRDGEVAKEKDFHEQLVSLYPDASPVQCHRTASTRRTPNRPPISSFLATLPGEALLFQNHNDLLVAKTGFLHRLPLGAACFRWNGRQGQKAPSDNSSGWLLRNCRLTYFATAQSAIKFAHHTGLLPDHASPKESRVRSARKYPTHTHGRNRHTALH